MANDKISISMDGEELICLCIMLKGGKMFAAPDVIKNVNNVLVRLARKLKRLGLEDDIIKRMTEL